MDVGLVRIRRKRGIREHKFLEEKSRGKAVAGTSFTYLA